MKYPIGLGIIISSHRLITGILRNNEENIYLDQNLEIILTTDRTYSHLCSHEIIYGNFIDFMQSIELTDCIKIGPQILVRVIGKGKNCVKVEVVKDGLLYSNMDLFLHPRTRKSVHLKTEEKMDLTAAIAYDCEFLIFPCPLNVCVLDYLKALKSIYNRKTAVLAKVELNKIQLFRKEIEYLAENYDGIWLADCSSPREEHLLNYIFNRFLFSRKHILCTPSMSTREITLQGLIGYQNNNYFAKIDSLVVSNAFNTNCRNLVHNTYTRMNEEIAWNYNTFMNLRGDFESIHCEYIRKAVLLSFKYKASCVLIINESGKSVLRLSQARPLIPILAVFENQSSAKQLTICRNVYSIVSSSTALSWPKNLLKQLEALVVIGKSLGFIKYKSTFVFCFQTEMQLGECDAFQICIDN